jgi:hypothetical protein
MANMHDEIQEKRIMKTLERVARSIARRRGIVILRSELRGLGSYSQVTRSLEELIRTGKLVRVGKGVYVKTRLSSITGRRIPAGSLETVAAEVLRKLSVEVSPGKQAREYNSGSSTQVPMRFVVNTGTRRISRRIIVGGRSLAYENNFKRA